MITIEYKTRDAKKKAELLRREGEVPAVFYGPKEKSTPISVKALAFKKVWKEAGESSIVILKDGKGVEHESLIYDVEVHPVTGVALHADFYVIEKGKKLQVSTPLEFKGVSEAVKSLGGTLVKVLHELEIEALPKDLPHELIVDISALATIDSQILAQDIKLPEGVTLITSPEEVIAAITVAVEEAEEPADAPSIADIEVVGAKDKKTEEGEAQEADADKK
jgi:large subunit ribosomal protein L25